MNKFHTSSKARPQSSVYSGQVDTSSKKRPRDDMSGQMSQYNSYLAQSRDFAEDDNEPDLKRVNANELERHMKSKKQLYACLTLEGRSPWYPDD